MENKKEINIKVSGKDWENYIEKAYTKLNKKFKIDGFRVGKAPKETFMKKYGMNVMTEASDIAVHEEYHKMIEANKDLEIIAQPSVEFKNLTEEEFEFDFVLQLKPTVKLGKYKNLNVKKETVKVTKEEVEQTINEMRKKYSENVIKDGTIENGDIAVIDFEGFKDNVPFEGGKGDNYSLTIGSNTFIPGFEEQLIGLKVNEEKEVNVTFPENYHSEDLKGQPVVFKVKINEIKQVVIPEINSDFFEDLGMEGIDSMESLEKQVEENIKVQKEQNTENKYIDELLDKAVENMEVEVPEVMINEELDRILKQYEQNLSMQGITLEQFYQFTNTKEEDLKKQFNEEAIKRIKSRLLLEEISAAEKIEITEEQANQEAEDLAKKYQMEKDELLASFNGIDMIKYDLQMRAAIEILKENN